MIEAGPRPATGPATGPGPGPLAPAGARDGDHAPISRIVAEVAEAFPGERISLGEMSEAFGERAFGLLILLLCLPGLLPGMASVFGLPMLVLGVQMGLGLTTPRLPGFLARRTVRRADLLRLATASSRWLRPVERFCRPRPGWFTQPFAERLVGWTAAYAALMLILPGPGTNGPPAFGTIVMSLGLVEQDSRVVGIGLGLTIAGCIFATGVLVALCWVGVKAYGWLT